MAKIEHIAMTAKDPAKVAEFYKEAFDMQELGRSNDGAVYLTDGYINLTIINCKTEKDADVGANGPDFSGIHHIGFQVDDLDEAGIKLVDAKAQELAPREELKAWKWAGPDGVVIDLSQIGWRGALSPGQRQRTR